MALHGAFRLRNRERRLHKPILILLLCRMAQLVWGTTRCWQILHNSSWGNLHCVDLSSTTPVVISLPHTAKETKEKHRTFHCRHQQYTSTPTQPQADWRNLAKKHHTKPYSYESVYKTYTYTSIENALRGERTGYPPPQARRAPHTTTARSHHLREQRRWVAFASQKRSPAPTP